MECMNKCGTGLTGRQRLFCSDRCRVAHKRGQTRSPTAELMLSSVGYVYLIHCVGFPYYKIGITTAKTPVERLQTLQTGLPFKLELLISMPITNANQAEQYLHKYYGKYRIRGEWFNFTEDVLVGVLAKYDHIKLFYRMTA